MGVSTREPKHLNFLYECSDQFSIIPTYWTIPSVKTVFDSTIIQDALIAYNIRGDPVKVCHNLIDFWLRFYKTQTISDFVFEGFISKIWLLFIDLIVVKLHEIGLRFWEIFLNWTIYLFIQRQYTESIIWKYWIRFLRQGLCIPNQRLLMY